ncbi:MAG TPA: hypothetical protein VIM67_00140 [Terriglobus sp.]
MDSQQKQELVGVTTVESNDRRHLVQPYQDRPTVELRKGAVGCPFCGNSHFRRSRLRFTDLAEILMLRYPVRCTRCSQRQFTDLYIAMMSYPPKFRGERMAQDHDSWKNWTGQSASSSSVRPLSTAMEPKARNLNPSSSTHAVAASSTQDEE